MIICVGSISVFSREPNQRQNDKSLSRVNYQPVGSIISGTSNNIKEDA